jgi:hypothetical protein
VSTTSISKQQTFNESLLTSKINSKHPFLSSNPFFQKQSKHSQNAQLTEPKSTKKKKKKTTTTTTTQP